MRPVAVFLKLFDLYNKEFEKDMTWNIIKIFEMLDTKSKVNPLKRVLNELYDTSI